MYNHIHSIIKLIATTQLAIISSLMLMAFLGASISTANASSATRLELTQDADISAHKITLSLSRSDSQQITKATDIVISGINHSAKPAILVLRVDDKDNPPYNDRINLERVIAPGPFTISQLLGGLTTASQRQLSLNQIQQIIIFSDDNAISLERAELITHPPLPAGSIGWDFGPAGSALWPGFQAVTITDSMITGGQMLAIDRGSKMQANEGLTTDGINGITQVHLPLAAGLWGISLWLRDPGEWEYLPAVTTRSISVNGTTVDELKLSSEEWFDKVYLGRQWPEASGNDNSYQRFALSPFDSLQVIAASQGQGVTINLSGNQPQAGFIAAILAEPITQSSSNPSYLLPQKISADKLKVLTGIEQARALWWQSNWPLAPWPEPQPKLEHKPEHKLTNKADNNAKALAKADGANSIHNYNNDVIMLSKAPSLVAPGSWFNVSYRLDEHLGDSDIMVQAPRLNSTSLPTQIRYGHWQWQRSGLKSTLLIADDQLLKSGLPPKASQYAPQNTYLGQQRAQQIAPHTPSRMLHLRIKVPSSAAPGRYLGQVDINKGTATISLPIAVEVMPDALPHVKQSIGVYLEPQVQFGWLNDTQAMLEQGISCDLAFLKQQGLPSVAPPLTTPTDKAKIQKLISELQELTQQGFAAPVLAYTPLKRLIASQGVEQATATLADVSQQLSALGLSEPIWVSADEPSNPDGLNHLEASFRYMRAFSPKSRLAGHLNHQGDSKWLNFFDLVLLNDGFGINQAELNKLPAALEVWLYNLTPARHAAGFYLWQSQAEGLMLWHGRMPTADPFNPTDGRESDIQFLYPSAMPCPLEPDVNLALFELTDGITDLQWLLWLEQQASVSNNHLTGQAAARALLVRLQHQVPKEWQAMAAIPSSRLDDWRQQIMTLYAQSTGQTKHAN
ncbi:hypothetical protein FJQ87_17030 [Shewanella sp. SNU WT4]|uniref:hypothetical protein n=1 Tax=Shewanella sp. SNU WT4 TaxID=2590015 RepID=UPI00112EC881|nr:hypothetical protein [Shewanella sp. SNU WT4]QDF68142.1 hypothetical protein FJQ87_17030 [Shewanella sp. SNU WT4]